MTDGKIWYVYKESCKETGHHGKHVLFIRRHHSMCGEGWWNVTILKRDTIGECREARDETCLKTDKMLPR